MTEIEEEIENYCKDYYARRGHYADIVYVSCADFADLAATFVARFSPTSSVKPTSGYEALYYRPQVGGNVQIMVREETDGLKELQKVYEKEEKTTNI